MTTATTYGDLSVEVGDDHVATLEIRRPPNNHIDVALVDSLAAALADLDGDDRVRALVLCAVGKHLPAEVRSVIARERAEQARLRTTEDWQEGVVAMAERRLPTFHGR